MKRILITGAAGFFGHHLVEHVLRKTDWDVVGLEGINYAGNLCRFNNIDCFNDNRHRVKMVWHDLRSPINTSVSHHIGKVDYVVHLAAETHVDRSLVDSIPFVTTNVLGTCHLLEYIKNCQNIEKYVQFSTDEVFGAAGDGVYYKEWDRHKPSNPYSASKAGADDLAFSFSHSFKLPIIITHCMNMFGEGQDVEKFVPMTIRNILLGNTVVIHGTENSVSTRKWVHCRNAASAVVFLLDRGVAGDKYNIAGDEMDVLTMANIIAREIGKPLNFEYFDYHKERPGHDLRYSLDDSKLASMGWVAPVKFMESLKRVVEWSLNHKEWLNIE